MKEAIFCSWKGKEKILTCTIRRKNQEKGQSAISLSDLLPTNGQKGEGKRGRKALMAPAAHGRRWRKQKQVFQRKRRGNKGKTKTNGLLLPRLAISEEGINKGKKGRTRLLLPLPEKRRKKRTLILNLSSLKEEGGGEKGAY